MALLWGGDRKRVSKATTAPTQILSAQLSVCNSILSDPKGRAVHFGKVARFRISAVNSIKTAPELTVDEYDKPATLGVSTIAAIVANAGRIHTVNSNAFQRMGALVVVIVAL